MSKAIFSRTKLCPGVVNSAVANLIKIFVFPWARLILFMPTSGCDVTATEDGAMHVWILERKRVSLVLELMTSRATNKSLVELISLPTDRTNQHTPYT